MEIHLYGHLPHYHLWLSLFQIYCHITTYDLCHITLNDLITISYQPGSPVWRYSVHIVNNSHRLHSILFSHKCRVILSP